MYKIIVYSFFFLTPLCASQQQPSVDIIRFNQASLDNNDKSQDVALGSLPVMQNVYKSAIVARKTVIDSLVPIEKDIESSLYENYSRYAYMLDMPVSLAYATELLQNYNNDPDALSADDQVALSTLNNLFNKFDKSISKPMRQKYKKQIHDICLHHKDRVYGSYLEHENHLHLHYYKKIQEQDIVWMSSFINNCDAVMRNAKIKQNLLRLSNSEQNNYHANHTSIALQIQKDVQDQLQLYLRDVNYGQGINKQTQSQQLVKIEGFSTDLDEKIALAQTHFDKISQLYNKEQTVMKVIQEDSSLDLSPIFALFDHSYALLEKYKQKNEHQILSTDERLKMQYLDAYLTEYEKQIHRAVLENKHVGIFKILAKSPCREIKINLTTLCLDDLVKTSSVHQTDMQKYQNELQILFEQKKLQEQTRLCIHKVLATMHQVNSAFDEHAAKSVMFLCGMKMLQKQSDIIDWSMEHDIVVPLLDDALDKAFGVLQTKEHARFCAAWQEQQLLNQQEKEKINVQRIEMQKKAEQAKEELRLQEVAVKKIQKSQQRKAARYLEKENQQKIIAEKELAKKFAMDKKIADITYLDSLAKKTAVVKSVQDIACLNSIDSINGALQKIEQISLQAKKVESFITLAENNIVNIQEMFNEVLTSDRPLNGAIGIIVYYVEQLGLPNFDKQKFFDNAVVDARMLKACNIQGDVENRSLLLQELLQGSFESIIQGGVSSCSDVQAANLAKLYNLLVDFLEDKFDL